MHLWLWGLAGCLSAERAAERFDAFVADHASCNVDEDCVVVYASCPLGCFAAVSADAEQEALDLADRLVRRYEAPGRACAYDCLAVDGAVCNGGTCEAVPATY